jgi:hypothetical protein
MKTITLALLFASSAAPAFAQDAAPPPKANAAPKVKVERSASGQKIFRIQESIVVEGKIQKPNAFYILERSSIDYDDESLKKDFLPKILQATSSSPF